MKVLNEIGVVFESEKAIEIFKDNNIKVDGNRVFLDEETVMEAIKSVPSEFILTGRTREDDVVIGDGSVCCSPGGGYAYFERGGKRDYVKKDDFVDVLKIYQTSDHIDVINANLCGISDIDLDELDEFRLNKCLELTTKPMAGFVEGRESSLYCIKKLKDFYEDDSKYYAMAYINPSSPLYYDECMTEGLIAYAEENQPIVLSSCSLPGVSSPVTIAGTVVVNNAEVLAGLVLTQLIKKGVPFVYGNVSSITDMKTFTPATGAVESSFFIYATQALCEYYGLPSRSGGSFTEAGGLDVQAGIEATYSLASTFMTGIDLIIHSVGTVDAFTTLSMEKIIIDEENINMAKRYSQGYEINDETICYDVIKEVGCKGNYTMNPHTLDNFRKEFYISKLITRGNVESDQINKIIKEKIDERLNNYVQPQLSEHQKDCLYIK
jgi:trimethylamine--corrinoid protein Co-methyltransferase